MTRIPRLVVTDLDGTFLSSDGTVSRTNANAVRGWCAAGRHFLVATGRPLRWLEPIHDIGGIRPRVIASNGAVVHDLATGTDLARYPIDPAVAAQVIADLRAAIPGTAVAVETGQHFGYEARYQLNTRLEPELASTEVGAIDTFLARGGCVKLLVQNLEHTPDELAALAEPVVAGRLTVTHSAASGRGLLEVSAPGVSKASTLAILAAELGVDPADVAAFGDMPNDRDMLQWAGQPHVMENAHPDLRHCGTRIGSNDDSAVGRQIAAWLAS